MIAGVLALDMMHLSGADGVEPPHQQIPKASCNVSVLLSITGGITGVLPCNLWLLTPSYIDGKLGPAHVTCHITVYTTGTCHKLGHADVIGSCRGFTTLSAVLGMMTMYTHEGLLQALASETNSAALIAMLRFAAFLFGMTPYQRLPPTLLPRILQVCALYSA